jgi:toxin ParE1/3/4
MARVNWTDTALEHVRQLIGKIRREDPPTAEKWATKLLDAPDVLVNHPHIGAVVEEFELDHVRELIVGTFRVVYTVRGDECTVVAVIRGQRDIRRVLDPETFS